ncbi:MAG: hypothetical protein J7647_27825 [Cyanobacteria bacterium SBLK]|nr:hypothetical protein [Cyanobacteria bacterium SBLK]
MKTGDIVRELAALTNKQLFDELRWRILSSSIAIAKIGYFPRAKRKKAAIALKKSSFIFDEFYRTNIKYVEGLKIFAPSTCKNIARFLALLQQIETVRSMEENPDISLKLLSR